LFQVFDTDPDFMCLCVGRVLFFDRIDGIFRIFRPVLIQGILLEVGFL